MRVSNPYIYAAAQARYGAIPLDEMRGKLETAADAEAMRRLIDRYMLARDRLVARYSWAIPNAAALRALAAAAPLIEIGAGNGYWAYLLRQLGVDILAFDANPPLEKATRTSTAGTPWPSARCGLTCSPEARSWSRSTRIGLSFSAGRRRMTQWPTRRWKPTVRLVGVGWPTWASSFLSAATQPLRRP